MAMAFPPPSSMALTTAEAAPASLAYVMATLAPSAASRFAIAAPIPREPPVTSATLFASLDIDLLCFGERFTTTWVSTGRRLCLGLLPILNRSVLYDD